MKDVLKVLAFSFVYGTSIYGTKIVGLDAGKNNLESYFIDKLGWSKYRLNKSVKVLRDSGVYTTQKSHGSSPCPCYSVSGKRIAKLQLLTL